MYKVKFSIIIPTFNRKDILFRCLQALSLNKINHSHEIIIVDDGSTDGTEKVVKDFKRKFHEFPLFYYKLERSGPAKVRNYGIQKAKGEILLFIGDDSIADQNLLEEHIKWHTKKYTRENYAILGLSLWSTEIDVTPFMRWLDRKKLQFSYSNFKNEHSPHPYQFWTCNISVKKAFLDKFGYFDEEFPYAAWEDVELGWRLSKKGLKIKYNNKAIVYHHHPTSFETLKKRMYYHGYSQMIISNKMGNDYSNPLQKNPLKTVLKTIDRAITLSGLLKVFDKIDSFLENKFIVGPLFLIVLYHYKLQGIMAYEQKN